MPADNFTEIKFLAEKVHAHDWPLDTPKWSELTIKKVDDSLNNNKEKKQIVIKSDTVLVGNYEFTDIKKVGLTIPLFQKQSTLIFEGRFEKLYAHDTSKMELCMLDVPGFSRGKDSLFGFTEFVDPGTAMSLLRMMFYGQIKFESPRYFAKFSKLAAA